MMLLDSNRDVVLFCRDATGSPVGYPMRTVEVTPATLTFTTYRKSAKVRNIERDGRVCVFAARRADGWERWASIGGRARIVTPSEAQIERLFGDGAQAGPDPGRVPAGMSDFVQQRLRDGKRVLIEVEDLTSAGILEGAVEA
jgi:Pyridoxamine 5'-phosphate oxidase